MSTRPIYLDYMATTPIDPRVIEVMLRYMGPSSAFGNPASTTHCYGIESAKAIDLARQQIADVIGVYPQEIIFTSGATEANNLAILGAARFYQRKGRHLITARTEHKSVLDSFYQLEREGFEVTYLNPGSDGLLTPASVLDALREDTILVSIMHVNNEIGVIQDIEAIAHGLHGKGIIFHVDAAQSAGKLALNLQTLPVDLMSFSAHKLYGPKGIGALFVRQKPRIRLQALSFGGGHEGGLRSGTLATHQIAGMGEAFAIAEKERLTEQARLLTWRNELWDTVSRHPTVQFNGSREQRIPGNLNFSVKNTQPDALLMALHPLALSTASACLSASSKSSYVLHAIGLSDELAYSTIRLCLGRFTTQDEINETMNILDIQLAKLGQTT